MGHNFVIYANSQRAVGDLEQELHYSLLCNFLGWKIMYNCNLKQQEIIK